MDVSNKDKVAGWVSDCARESSRIDVIVANVSSLSIPDTVENWQTTFQTDLMGTWKKAPPVWQLVMLVSLSQPDV